MDFVFFQSNSAIFPSVVYSFFFHAVLTRQGNLLPYCENRFGEMLLMVIVDSHSVEQRRVPRLLGCDIACMKAPQIPPGANL